MLKTLCVCFVCILIVLTNAQNVQQISPTQKLEEHFYYKCFNKTRNLLPYQVLYNDTSNFMKHVSEAAQLLPDKKRTFCERERRHLVTKIEKVSRDLTPCLVPEEEYMSKFLESFVKEFLYFLCENDGQNMDRLFSAQGRTCAENIEKDNSNELENCFGKIFPPVSDKYVTKRELCENMDVAQKCFNIMLDRKCPHTKSMHELNEKFFKYVGKTCSGCVSNYLSILLLIMSIVLPFTFKH